VLPDPCYSLFGSATRPLTHLPLSFPEQNLKIRLKNSASLFWTLPLSFFSYLFCSPNRGVGSRGAGAQRPSPIFYKGGRRDSFRPHQKLLDSNKIKKYSEILETGSI
jgi:hypothetical protein